MNATCSLCCRWVCCVLTISGLCLAVVLGEGAGEDKTPEPAEEKAKKLDAKEAAKMVNAMANRNKPPEIVSRHKRFPSKLPLYPKDYDWMEEAGVHAALRALYQDTSVELWEALVQKSNDQRYCVVLFNGSTSDARIVTVGSICGELAYSRLCHVFEKQLPSLPPHGCPIQLNIRNLSEWRKERKDKTVNQLQIEACKLALGKLSEIRATTLSDKEKVEARKKIEVEIAKLHGTKGPFLGEPAKGFIAAYLRKEAERVREAYDKGVLEKFRSGLNK